MSWFGKETVEEQKDEEQTNGDYCTSFPEFWWTWRGEYIYIGWMCKDHDKDCGSHGFYKDTWNSRLIGATLIATFASIACWIKYTKKMKRRL